MTRSTTMGLAVLGVLAAVGCEDPLGPQLEATDRCVSQSDQNSVVAFEDANLAAQVRADLDVGPSEPLTCRMVAELESLGASNAGIASLVGMQNLTGLQNLVLANNAISDLGPLSDLVRLEFMDLQENDISDLTPLSGLDNVVALSLTRNAITDIEPLAPLVDLELLALDHNEITDIRPLAGMANMLRLVLFGNQITEIGSVAGMTRPRPAGHRRESIAEPGARARPRDPDGARSGRRGLHRHRPRGGAHSPAPPGARQQRRPCPTSSRSSTTAASVRGARCRCRRRG